MPRGFSYDDCPAREPASFLISGRRKSRAAARGEYVDLVEAGIIDPTKLVRLALENAVSVAGVLLLTEGTLTEAPEPKGEKAGVPELQEA